MSGHRPSRLQRVLRALFLLFLVAVAVLLLRYARGVDWAQVGAAIAGYDAPTLAIAAALTLASYLIYGGYDLAARRYTRHALSTRRVLAIAVTSYAFSLNLGALIGGAGFRYRLYSHSGLGAGTISRIIGFSVVTNWLGYVVLAGGLFAIQVVALPAAWQAGRFDLRLPGLAMLLVAVAYLVGCRLSHGRVLHFRRHHFRLPSLPLALLQLLLASVNWAAMAAIVYVLMQRQVGYPLVLGTLLLGAVATALVHIPAGIGVLEAVFLAVLGDALPQAQLFAALLTYRALYYLAPLLVAIAIYAVFEARGKQHPPG